MTEYAAILSARMSSDRLPGKALADYGAGPNLGLIIRRWKGSKRNPKIVVATPDTPDNDPIQALAEATGLPCYRGHNMSALAQMDAALRLYAPTAVVVARALGDNPLVDMDLADWRYDTLVETGSEGLWYGGDHDRITYAATTDVWSRAGWDKIVESSTGEECDHPGLYFWNHIEKFSAVQLPLPRREYLAQVRTELDTPADLEMLKALYSEWGEGWLQPMPTLWALDYLTRHPEVAAINAEVKTKTQTAPAYARGNAWVCPGCRQRIGGIVLGNLTVRCSRCGKPRKYFAHKPLAREAHIR